MDAVIFDMDGVILVDTEQHWHEQEQEFYAEVVADDADPQQLIDDLTGMYFKEIYDAIAEQHPVAMDKDTFVQRFHAMAEAVYREATLMPGFFDLVDELQGSGVKVAVATSSPRRWIDTVNDRFALADQVSFILSAEDLDGSGKPDPLIYVTAAERLGVDPARCVAVEDSLNGIRAAAAAGMETIGFNPHAPDGAAEIADAVVADAAELRTVLRSRL